NNHIDCIQLDLFSEYNTMEFLALTNNRLTDGAIEGAFEGVPVLKRLYLDTNQLQSVPNDLPTSLEELRLDNNQVEGMSETAWTHCPGLLILSMSNNSLGNGTQSLPIAVLSPLCKLRALNLDHNQLTSVPLGLPLSIKELYLKGNRIEEFRNGAFDGKSELVVLDLSKNRLTNKGLHKDSLVNATHLESLNLEGNRLKQIPQHLPLSLKTLNLESNFIRSIKKRAFGALKNLEHLGLTKNKIFKVAVGAFRTLPVLHQLDLGHNRLRQVPRQLPKSLHSVSLTHNTIQTVPRDSFCWGNTTLSLSGLLRWLNLNRNKITSNGVEQGVLSTMSQLAHLYMDDNLLSSVPSPLPPSLEHLRLSRNRISKIPAGVFSGLNKLNLLDLQSNKLMDDAVTEVSLKGLTNLVQINLSKNQLTSMPIGLPPTTTQLFLDGNNIDKIPADYFKGLPKMTFIRLNYNKLASSGVPKDVFNVSSILDLQL
ncbi:hypothetical protein NQD34_016887, partial [Periophthalmus magnuspinnatus]